jgi:hypothetical protein
MAVKKIDLSQLSLKKIIVHDIPQHRLNDLSVEPRYSENLGTLTDGLKIFFRTKILQALQSDKAIKVQYDSELPSPIQYLVEEELDSKEGNFVLHSKEVAKHLFTIQGGVNSGGILVVMLGEVAKEKHLIIMKLERDNGVQLRIDEKTKSIDITEVENLMMTNRTKIFKIALLMLRTTSVDYDGIVTDYQIDFKIKNQISSFFITKFLGCRPYKDPKTTTQDFYRLTKEFIKTIDDDVKKAKYMQDLNSYLQMNSQMLSAKEFAENYLSTTGHKNKYKAFMGSKNFRFDSFVKDTTLISSKIEKISLEFVNGITILGKKGTFKDKVKLTNLENNQLKAEVTSKLKRLD